MESKQIDQQSPTERTEGTPAVQDKTTASQTEVKPRQTTEKASKSIKVSRAKAASPTKAGKSLKKKSKGKKKAKVVSSSDESDSESDSDSDTDCTSETSDSASSTGESESESDRKKRKTKEKKNAKQRAKDKKKAKSKRKSKKESSSDSDSDSDSSETPSAGSESDADDSLDILDDNAAALQLLQLQSMQNYGQPSMTGHPYNANWSHQRAPTIRFGKSRIRGATTTTTTRAQAARRKKLNKALHDLDTSGSKKSKSRSSGKSKKKRASRLEYKRVDQLWDSTIHNYKLTDTAVDEESSEYDQYLFNVRRTFDWEGKYKNTVVDIKSKLLKEALNDVMDGVKGISLVEDTPVVDPNLLFLYLEDLRKSIKELRAKVKGGEKMKKKIRKRNETKIRHVKVLLKYLDKDYAETKKTLYPMLESGLITFDLLWALFKPNTLAYTTTYGTADEPRAFRIEYAEKEYSFMRGEWYSIEGRYLEYDGKAWGMGTMDCDVAQFKGARKITSLACYPLCYHRDEAGLRAQLIARGRKFVALQGVHYKSHEGLAYYKKKRQVIKVNINGRIMVDPAIHRRILPNYQVSTVKPKDPDDEAEDVDDDDDDDDDGEASSGCGCGSSDDEYDNNNGGGFGDDDDGGKTKLEIVLDDRKQLRLVCVPVDADGQEIKPESLEALPSKGSDGDVTSKDAASPSADKNDNNNNNNNNNINDASGEAGDTAAAAGKKRALPVFSDDEYLIASPVVLGFAFGEKLWLEFTVSGVRDIEWNAGAYESLVLEPASTKEIVRALVESHTYHAAESIDDVIQGKGRGLVAVLHGPPGTGKTLTAEGISEMMHAPLYMVSAGELGTDPRTLEAELQKILDIAHAWGAILLLDEADVFLEKRTIQDIHRNALVSIFLRLLEYFQGILFLTTNRVETFDDAFQSRIHIALRYGELSHRAKVSVFRMFIERVRALEGATSSSSSVSSSASSVSASAGGGSTDNGAAVAAAATPTTSTGTTDNKTETKGEFSDEDLAALARHSLNGRQIKNTVRTAQALAVNKGEALAMSHIRRVLDVALSFDRDLKGGPGFEDAMRGYM